VKIKEGFTEEGSRKKAIEEDHAILFMKGADKSESEEFRQEERNYTIQVEEKWPSFR